MFRNGALSSPARMFFYMVVSIAVVATIASPAKADLVHFGDFFLDAPLGDPAAEEAFVEDEIGGDVTFLAKFEPACTAGNCALDITVDIDGTEADISWDLTGTGTTLEAVLLKDGNVSGQGHLYTIWVTTADQKVTSDGIQTVHFGPPGDEIERGISHISTFGGDVPVVPEPMTLVLVGVGLLGTALIGRKAR